MKLYKIINENNVSRCPKNGTVNGKAISNLEEYFNIHPEIARKEGYKPLEITDPPDVDPAQYAIEPIYTETANNIRQEWIVKNIEEVI